MKRTMLFLSAVALASASVVTNAKMGVENPDFGLVEMGTCSCNLPEEVEVEITNDDGSTTTVMGQQYNCAVDWQDAIGGSEDPATYGASFDVEVMSADGEETQELDANIDLDWSVVCSTGTCMVAAGDAPFVLYNVGDTDVVMVEASVKAFKTGRAGGKPRNFIKSTVDCPIGEAAPTGE